MYASTRQAGLGDEVKRRILTGTYALSAGFYDAYYKRAQQVCLLANTLRKGSSKLSSIVMRKNCRLRFLDPIDRCGRLWRGRWQHLYRIAMSLSALLHLRPPIGSGRRAAILYPCIRETS